jgi:hypothetical protein
VCARARRLHGARYLTGQGLGQPVGSGSEGRVHGNAQAAELSLALQDRGACERGTEALGDLTGERASCAGIRPGQLQAKRVDAYVHQAPLFQVQLAGPDDDLPFL